jgi:hypothetical protein
MPDPAEVRRIYPEVRRQVDIENGRFHPPTISTGARDDYVDEWAVEPYPPRVSVPADDGWGD